MGMLPNKVLYPAAMAQSSKRANERTSEPRPVSSVPPPSPPPPCTPLPVPLQTSLTLYTIPTATTSTANTRRRVRATRGPLGRGRSGAEASGDQHSHGRRVFYGVTMEEARGRRKRRHRGQKLLDELQMLQMSCLRAKAHRGAKRRSGHCRGLPSSSRPMNFFPFPSASAVHRLD